MNVSAFTDLFEAITIFCFGLSWPIAIYKSVKSRTTQGKSFYFELLLLIGYAFGIVRKIIMAAELGYDGFLFYMSFFFYVLNFLEITVDLVLYIRNLKFDKLSASIIK